MGDAPGIGLDGFDVVTVGIVEVLGDLLFGRIGQVILIQVHHLLGDIAVHVIAEGDEIATRGPDLDQVLVGIIAVGGGIKRQDGSNIRRG